MKHDSLPVAIIGAGPIGLAAACHLLARGEKPVVLEAGEGPGHTIRQWAHVSTFSPWEFMTDRAAVRLLEAHGWRHPPAATIPSGRDLIELYFEPLAQLPALQPRIRYRTRVTAVTRKGFDKVRTQGRDAQPFILRIARPDGEEEVVEAKRSSTLPAPGYRRTLPVQTGCRRSVKLTPLTGFITASLMCLEPHASVTPERL